MTSSQNTGKKLNEKAPEETESKYVLNKKDRYERESTWKARSAQMHKIGVNIHGGEKGYEVDMMFQMSKTHARIDAFLSMPKVQERWFTFISIIVITQAIPTNYALRIYTPSTESAVSLTRILGPRKGQSNER